MVIDAGVRATNGNFLLARLPEQDFELLSAHLERVELVQKRALYEPNQPIGHVYFPESGMVSLVGLLSDGSGVETASTGRDGMVGMPVFHGADRVAEQAVVQIPGTALRMTSDALRLCLTVSPSLRAALHSYAACMYTFSAQNTVCLAKHSTEKRLARWLLHAGDHIGTDELPLTHLFMSQMLSVRRSSITVTAIEIRRLGLISYTRSHITIVDRPGLIAFTCECYGIVRQTYERLLSGSETAYPLAQLVTSQGAVSVVRAS